MAISLLPDNPAAWTYRPFEDLYAIPREEREKLQLEAVRINFASKNWQIARAWNRSTNSKTCCLSVSTTGY